MGCCGCSTRNRESHDAEDAQAEFAAPAVNVDDLSKRQDGVTHVKSGEANQEAIHVRDAEKEPVDNTSSASIQKKHRLIGKWESDANDMNFEFEVCENRGHLILVFGLHQVSLIEDGDYMLAEDPVRFWRLKLGPSEDECIFRFRGKDTDWPKPRYAIRKGAIQAGSLLVSNRPAALYDSSDYSSIGSIGTHTLVEAAGPTEHLGGRFVPIKPSGLIQQSHLRIQEEDSPRAEYVPGETQSHESQRYYELPSIFEALKENDTILVKGTWMQKQGDASSVLPRRQELPIGAAWEPLQCIRFVNKRRVLMIAVSYCWTTPDHPDPNGEQLKLLAKVIRIRISEERLPLDDLAVFFDWVSLLQKKRTESEETVFKRSLAAVNLWYGHAMVMCWLLTRVPVEVLAYDRRGWPTFERAVSSFIKDNNKVLDLGKLDESCGTWWGLIKACKAGRSPPIAPSAMAEVLKMKKFTNGVVDLDLVQKIYSTTFQEVMGALLEMDFTHVGLGEKEFIELAEALPQCEVMTRLKLTSNRPDKRGVEALATSLPRCSSLQELNMAGCSLDDEQATIIMGAAVLCTRLRSIVLDSNAAISPAGIKSIANICPRIPKLSHLGLNDMGQRGHKHHIDSSTVDNLVEMIPKCSPMTSLGLRRCAMRPADMRRIGAAWVAAGKEMHLLVLG